jgi:phenylalanyl-tRNA synthetase alpha chain
MQDTFFLNNGLILRTHTSTAQIDVLKKQKFPIKIFSMGQVFRNETIDATHNSMFYQMEIMYINDDSNVLSLKGTIELILKKFFDNDDIKIRFRSSFFPFVVPGFEVDVFFNNQWLEIAGCGMIHPNVMAHNDDYNNDIMGFAAGFGVDRLHMIKNNITDIRDLYINQNHLYKPL